MSVDVGDTIRFSVGLLKQLYDEPDHVSVRVRVREVRIEADGAKLLVLDRDDAWLGHCDCEQRGHPDIALHASDCRVRDTR